MIRNLWSSVVLFVLGELLSWVPSFFGSSSSIGHTVGSSFGEFTDGLLLGLSVGMKVVAILLIVITISKLSKQSSEKE